MYLVTGGAGFIGSNIVAALAARGERVAVCDWLGQDEKWRNLARHEIAEIIRPDDLGPWLQGRRGLKALVHMGAISSTTERDADLIAATNVALPQRLFAWCAEQRVPFLYASSAATYGDGSAGFDDDGSPRALARLKPLNAYGWSKHLFDRWVARQMAGSQVAPPQWAGLKFFNVYGPNEYHKGAMRSVALQLFQQMSAGEPATLFRSHRPDYPDGGQQRDFVHVEDCTALVLWLLENPQVSGLFNCGTGRAESFLAVARAVSAALGRPENVRFIDTPEPIRAKYQYFTEAKLDRLRAAGYERPFAPVAEGVAAYVTDHLLREDPYL
ncbi:MAG TPA: ADP-glyceromanno-heptose 6-epimerase [Kiloniellales bacterium]|nr:ADP-glyceromanno-heptose 6-epimerase [Kiloniellales bacterium]